MSSTDTLGPSWARTPSRNSTPEVAPLITQTSGRASRENQCIVGAASRANDSARRSASRFGTSSPSRSVTNDSRATKVTSAIGRAQSAIQAGA